MEPGSRESIWRGRSVEVELLRRQGIQQESGIHIWTGSAEYVLASVKAFLKAGIPTEDGTPADTRR